MDLNQKKVVVIGGAGLIGSHVVDELIKTPVREIVIYDNFARGTHENLHAALCDPRVSIFRPAGSSCGGERRRGPPCGAMAVALP